jgi:hypothetical protein
MSKESIVYAEKFRKPYPKMCRDIPQKFGEIDVLSIEIIENGVVEIDGVARAFNVVRIIDKHDARK